MQLDRRKEVITSLSTRMRSWRVDRSAASVFSMTTTSGLQPAACGMSPAVQHALLSMLRLQSNPRRKGLHPSWVHKLRPYSYPLESLRDQAVLLYK